MKATTWCKKHNACKEAINWIEKNNIRSMYEAWKKCKRSDWMLWVMEKLDYGTDKQLRLFAVWCARQIFTKDTNKQSIEACNVAERFANGKATRDELDTARTAVEYAEDAAWEAATYAARNAAWEAATYATWEVATYAAREVQANQLRKMFKNPFK